MNFSHLSFGSGTPVLFQHGLGASKEQTVELLDGERGLKVISMDAPGHGSTALTSHLVPSFNHYTDCVIELLDHLEVDASIFGGISMGSGIAINAAIRYPERVRGLILVRPAWLNRPNPANLGILLDAADHIESGSMAEFQHLEEFKSIQRKLPSAADSILGVFNPSQQKAMPDVLRSMVKDQPFNSMKDLLEIEKPCLIIGSEDDPLHPFRMAEIIHENIRESTIHKVISRYINNPKHISQVRNHVNKFITLYEESLER